MKSALAIGGTAALSTAVSLFGAPDTAAADGSVGLVARNNRQHAWDNFEAKVRGTSAPPNYHLILGLDYAGDGTPDGHERAAVEATLSGLEDAFAWQLDGLLFTIGYSPDYFERYEEDLPAGLAEGDTRLVDPATTIAATAAPHEKPGDIHADRYDAVFHAASTSVPKLLTAEEALWGNADLDLEGTFEGIFEKPTEYPDRRTGFAGPGVTKEEYKERGHPDLAEQIPEQSALSMGFNALYENSVPREELASMVEDQKLTEAAPPGVFAQGSVEHVSKLNLDLEDWYGNNDLEERRGQMLSPHHSREETGETGENLGDTNDPDEFPSREAGAETRDLAARTVEDARKQNVVGHVQKLARARFDVEARETGDPDDDPDDQVFETPILRRDFDTLDDNTPGTHFVAVMRFNGYMHYIRQAMNGTTFDTAAFGLTGEDRIVHESIVDEVGDADGDGDTVVGDTDDDGDNNNGIVPYLETTRRGNFLVPPITVRALPPARGIRPNEAGDGFQVRTPVRTDGEGQVVVHLNGAGEFDPADVDEDTIRFGAPGAVNRGGGVTPTEVEETPAGLRLVFPAGGGGFGPDSETARLFAKTTVDAGRLPVFATADVEVVGAGAGNGRGNGRGNGGDGGRGRGAGGRDETVRGGRGGRGRDDGARGGRGD